MSERIQHAQMLAGEQESAATAVQELEEARLAERQELHGKISAQTAQLEALQGSLQEVEAKLEDSTQGLMAKLSEAETERCVSQQCGDGCSRW